jgi:hypothetical protein
MHDAWGLIVFTHDAQKAKYLRMTLRIYTGFTHQKRTVYIKLLFTHATHDTHKAF